MTFVFVKLTFLTISNEHFIFTQFYGRTTEMNSSYKISLVDCPLAPQAVLPTTIILNKW